MKQYQALLGLNEEQITAVAVTEGPQLILAGAGSGKTRTLTHKIAYLCEKGINPSRILAITFTNKAAKEMKERISSLVGASSKKILASTFHSFCNRIIRKNHEYVGLGSRYTIYDQKDQEKLIKNLLKEKDDYGIDLKETLDYISSKKNKMTEPSTAMAEASSVIEDQLASIYNRYNKQLRKNNSVDFNDLLLLALKILNNKETAAYWKSNYRYIFVDEFQDTNLPQFKLVQALAEKYNNICVVGDDNQAIYGWRGSEIKYILDFNNWFSNSKLFKLETNYRSTPTILKAASSVIDLNILKTSKEIIPFKQDNEHKVYLMKTYDEYDEAFQIVKRIKKLLKTKNPRDFAVLYRTNMQSRVLEEEFIANDIPYKIEKGTNFYARKEIKDIIAFIKVILNTRDEISLERILNFPPRRIGKKVLNSLKNYSKLHNVSLWKALLSKKDNIHISSFVEKIKELQKIDRADTLVKSIINDFELIEYWQKIKKDINDVRVENIYEFISTAQRYFTKHKGKDILAFLEFLSLMSSEETNNPDSVTLMTAHASKGLEYPIVFVTGAAEGLFPLACKSNKQLEEERRLFYVALTRAEEIAYITYSTKRNVYGRAEYFMRSHFIDAIEESNLTKMELNNDN